MLPKKVDLRGAESVLLLAHNPDGTVTVAIEGTPDQVLRLVCDSIGIASEEKDFALLLLAGVELYCLNHATTLEDLTQNMRERITLSIPNNNNKF